MERGSVFSGLHPNSSTHHHLLFGSQALQLQKKLHFSSFNKFNMEHYGECRKEQLSKCGLDGSTYATEEKAVDDRTIGHNSERLSLLKAGIVYSNLVVTVSPTYLKETLCSGWLSGTLIYKTPGQVKTTQFSRSNYAEKQLKIMQQLDEDHTLTQLANAWVNLAVGGSKIQEANLIFQDFAEKYRVTSLILNGKALCCMHKGEFADADRYFLE